MSTIIDYIEEQTSPDIQANDLGNISELGRQLVSLEEEIKQQEEALKNLKQKHRKLGEELLPDKLRELGVSEFKLKDGTSMSVQKYYSARITPENREVCFHWLENNGLGDVIKNTVSANFGRGEDEAAQELMLKLEDEGHTLAQKKWVEPMTLKAVVREQVEKGNDLPLESFNVYIGQKIKVKR
jgi:glucose-6-phosphate-specific signal transduction histidine kinase